MRIRLFGQHLQLSILVLAALEMTLFFFLLFGAGVVRLGPDLHDLERLQGPLWPSAVAFSASMVMSLLAFGLYSARQRARSAGIFIRILAAVITGIGVTALVFYIIQNPWIGHGVLLLAAVSAAAAVMVLRLGFSRIIDETPFKRRVLVYGTGRNAAAITGLRRRADQRGFTLLGFVRPEGESMEVPAERMLAGALSELCARLGAHEIVVAMDDRRRAFPIREMLECRLAGIDVTEVLTFLERETGRVRTDLLHPTWLVFGEGFRRGSVRRLTSSLISVTVSLLILIVTLPITFATVLAIALEDGWGAPILYRQERVGLGGRTFQLLKFRSMRVDAEANAGAQWAQRNDPRVTAVGSIIRKFRIDELPQVFNVLRGEMSFVGPRPERPEFVVDLAEKIPYYGQRHCVKPGITGWAQLCYPYGSSERDSLVKLQYDLYYIKNNSLLFDLSILAQTAEVVLLGKGAR